MCRCRKSSLALAAIFTDDVWVQDLFVLKFEMEDECIELDQKVSHSPCSRQLYLTAAGR